MPEIDFSFMIHTPETVDVLSRLLKEFEAQSGVRVNLHPLHWDTAHAELNKIALYHHGPDVSEIGSTWVSDLIAMNALRPFSQPEIVQAGKPEEFIAESWKTCHLLDDETQWAYPYLAESFVIHYRRDMLQKAGVDEAIAFSTHEQFAATAASLARSGVPVPVEFPLSLDLFSNLHELASWVWGAGGDFCSPDGKRVLFNQPAAQAGFRAYFDLLRSLSPDARRMMRERKGRLFDQGLSAIYFGTLMFYAFREQAPAELKENWRMARLPGAHFMGGSNLVIWKHTRNDRAALDLVRFLTNSTTQLRVALPLATLPPRLSALSAPQITNDPALSIYADSIRTGRTYHSVPLWGLIEDRLLQLVTQISNAAISDEEIDLDALIRQQTDAMARRLNITLAQ